MARLLMSAGRVADALAACRLARADQEVLAALPGASNDARLELADTIGFIGYLLWYAYKMAEAEPELRKAMAIYQQLADENPGVFKFSRRRRDQPPLPRPHVGMCRQAGGGRGRATHCAALYQKLADENPAVTNFRFNTALSLRYLGDQLPETGKASGGRVSRGDDDSAKAGRRKPRCRLVPI